MIIEGALDDGGTEAALAGRIGLSSRHLHRLFLRHLGASPDQLARSRRAHFARRLLDDTDLTVADIAFASGFGSLRQFNRAMQEVFRAPPTDLRNRRHRADRLAADGGLALRLPVVPGYDWPAVRAGLAARLIPGAEAVDGDTYRRTISVRGAPGLLEVSPGENGHHLLLRAHLPYWEGLIHIVDRAGRMLGADQDPGPWSQFEAGVWAILSRGRDGDALAGALGSVVTGLGTPVAGLPGGLTHVFPTAAEVTADGLARTGLPAADTGAIAALAAKMAGLSQ